MGVVLLAAILVNGFLFTNYYPPSRFRQKRSSGWDSYFHVATWGVIFTLLGVVATLLAWFPLHALSLVLSVAALVPGIDYELPSFGTWLLTYKISDDLPLAAVISLMFGALIAFGEAKQRRENLVNDYPKFMAMYGALAQGDGLEALFFRSMQDGLLVLITLKSRKVYVGKVHQPRFLHADVENVVIIPMLSGYRDKDDLTYKEKHSYIEYYRDRNIGNDSESLALDRFRTVIPRAEIESASLFDDDTYLEFSRKCASQPARHQRLRRRSSPSRP